MNSATADRGGSVLYTRDLLALAVSLAAWPLDPASPFSAEARSPTCGSTVRFGCSIGAAGLVDKPGVAVTACAIGQAAAALFIVSAAGRDRQSIQAARNAIARWLTDDGPLPEWPGLAVLDPARAYPARHGAILLAWNAALAALPKETGAS